MNLRITLLLSTLVTIAVVHTVSIEFYLYWKYLWLDIPMHILGGVACALGFSALPFFGLKHASRYTSMMWTVLFTLCVGVVWEMFEFSAGISQSEPGFFFDTVLDLVMDVTGGLIGFGVVRSLNASLS